MSLKQCLGHRKGAEWWWFQFIVTRMGESGLGRTENQSGSNDTEQPRGKQRVKGHRQEPSKPEPKRKALKRVAILGQNKF